jgi:hypothetical protein
MTAIVIFSARSLSLTADYETRSSKRMEQKESGVLPYQEFIASREWIEDMEDLLELREAKRAERNLAGRLEEIAKELGL